MLLDELGKGTEVLAGTALVGTLLEWLTETGAKGIIATHLHQLVDIALPLKERGVLDFWAMGVEDSIAAGRGQIINTKLMNTIWCWSDWLHEGCTKPKPTASCPQV